MHNETMLATTHGDCSAGASIKTRSSAA